MERVVLQSTLFRGERISSEDRKLDRAVLWWLESQRTQELGCLRSIRMVAGSGGDAEGFRK